MIIIMKPINAENNTVNYKTYAVAKRKPEEVQACRDPKPNLCETVKFNSFPIIPMVQKRLLQGHVIRSF